MVPENQKKASTTQESSCKKKMKAFLATLSNYGVTVSIKEGMTHFTVKKKN